ncbi:MAG: thioredoxin [Propionibacteriaceae bacterium]
MSNVAAITDQDFESTVLKATMPVLVDYWAAWCAPCKQLSPIIDELANLYDGRVLFYKMNADDDPITPAKFGVQGLPTLHLFINGEIVESVLGAKTKGALAKLLDKHL